MENRNFHSASDYFRFANKTCINKCRENVIIIKIPIWQRPINVGKSSFVAKSNVRQNV